MPDRVGLHRQRQVGQQVQPALVVGPVVAWAEGHDAGRVVTAPLRAWDDVGRLAWASTADKAGLVLDRRALGGARGGHRTATWAGAGCPERGRAGERGAFHRRRRSYALSKSPYLIRHVGSIPSRPTCSTSTSRSSMARIRTAAGRCARECQICRGRTATPWPQVGHKHLCATELTGLPPSTPERVRSPSCAPRYPHHGSPWPGP